jgi:hypothetical protein
VPAIQPYIIEPIFEQFEALLPEREANHLLGCHRPRIPDRVVFRKLVEVLVFGCAYWRISDRSCLATTLRGRRNEWIPGRPPGRVGCSKSGCQSTWRPTTTSLSKSTERGFRGGVWADGLHLHCGEGYSPPARWILALKKVEDSL